MSMTPFPHGIKVFGVPLLPDTSPNVVAGDVYWVGSVAGVNWMAGSNDTATAGQYATPFATIDYAVGRCTANNGDVIYILPGHTESVIAAGGITCDVAGVSIIGLGKGNSRPKVTLSTANTATITVSAANVSFQNIVFVGNFLSIASCFTVGAAPEFVINNCEFRDTSAILGFLSIVTTTVTVNADGLVFTNNKVKSDATTSPGPAVVIAGTIDRVNISDNFIVHTVASNNVSALLAHGALVVTQLLMARNSVYSVNTDTATGGILITTSATTGSGMIISNRIRALDVALAILVTATAVQYGMFDNLYTGEITLLSGFVLPAIGADAT